MKRDLKGIIFESPDNCGKDTQIALTRTHFVRKLVPFHVLHYSALSVEAELSRQYFKEHLYDSMFKLVLDNDENNIFALNRAHISENVYAPMYRHTDGEYVFAIEQFWKSMRPAKWDQLCLVTFVDLPKNLIERDDGKSFSVDLEKKKEEVNRFVDSTVASHINHKVVINIEGKAPVKVQAELMQFLKRHFNNV